LRTLRKLNYLDLSFNNIESILIKELPDNIELMFIAGNPIENVIVYKIMRIV
jgi:Leucine-rich repeat (LRR) protein